VLTHAAGNRRRFHQGFHVAVDRAFILAMYLGRCVRSLTDASRNLVQEALHIPGKIETILSKDAIYDELVAICSDRRLPVPGPAFTSLSRWKER